MWQHVVRFSRAVFYWCFVALWLTGCLLLLPMWLPFSLAYHLAYRPLVVCLYLRGDVKSAWERCLPLWRRQGSLDDRRGAHFPSYQPTLTTQIARTFAFKFKEEHQFIASRIRSSATEAPFALEMLVWICGELRAIPKYLFHEDTQIRARDSSASSTTLGEYFRRLEAERVEWENELEAETAAED
jgi:hypothetical protein